MYDVHGKPGKNGHCDWCEFEYSTNRKYGGFVPFIDPLYQSGVSTLYGVETCEHCYEKLCSIDVSKRLLLAIGAAHTSAPAEPEFLTYDLINGFDTGHYPTPAERTNISFTHEPSTFIRKGSSVKGVHLCLTRWSKSKSAPKAFIRPKREYRPVEPDSSLPGEPNKRGRRKPSLRGTRQLSLV
ncbi:MAG: hypothetical protein ACKVJE_21515 [Pseudomonadales bacterium]